MNIQFKGAHIDLTPSIKTYCDEKLGSIEKLLSTIDPETSAELDVELSRTSEHHQKGEVFMVEVHLKLPQKVFRASETSEDIRTAVDKIKDTLHRLVGQYKDVLVSERRDT